MPRVIWGFANASAAEGDAGPADLSRLMPVSWVMRGPMVAGRVGLLSVLLAILETTTAVEHAFLVLSCHTAVRGGRMFVTTLLALNSFHSAAIVRMESVTLIVSNC